MKDWEMLAATTMLATSLERWSKAVLSGDITKARFEADHLCLGGDLVVIHPDFRKRFQQENEGGDPEAALAQMCAFLLCATEARAEAMRSTPSATPGDA